MSPRTLLYHKSLPYFVLCLGFCFWGKEALAQSTALKIWFDEPARIWEETVPLGNGRIGMMPDGGLKTETIVLNEISLWSGSPQDADLPDAHLHVKEIQSLLLQGDHAAAEKLVNRFFVSKGPGSGHGAGAEVPYGCFQLMAQLILEWNHDLQAVEEYHRELDLRKALAQTSYRYQGINYKRQYYTSFHSDAGWMRFTADKKGALQFNLRLAREENAEIAVDGQTLILKGQLPDGFGGKGMQFENQVKVWLPDGQLRVENNILHIENATEALVLWTAGTDYQGATLADWSKTIVESQSYPSWEDDFKAHLSHFGQWMNRAELDFGGPQKNHLTTPQRLQAFYEAPEEDPGMAALYFQYGRYLSISSTRPGGLPPNLQGLWAHQIQTPWNGDYHLNINAQMNHWALEVGHLPELHQPFLKMIQQLAKSGEKTAKAYYNAPGWVCYMMTNVWGYSSPGEQASWGASTASGWLCLHLWEHYLFKQDIAYLREAYPTMLEAARFYDHMLIQEPTHGWWVTAPSVSPENAFRNKKGDVASVAIGPSIDQQIVRDLFQQVLKAAELLGEKDPLHASLQLKLQKMPPPIRISADGRVMEWLEELEEVEPKHRHVSHLYALYPAAFISPVRTPEWAEAAKKTLNVRGDGGTGWSRAWKILFWARLHDGEHALEIFRQLLQPALGDDPYARPKAGTYPNLFCSHPPFQIDGNFGGAAGIAEMILQSHEEWIDLLPALPHAWSEGSIKGWKARGNIEVDMTWKDGQVESLQLWSSTPKTVQVRKNGVIQEMQVNQK